MDRLVLSSSALNHTGEMEPVQCQTEWIKGERFKVSVLRTMMEKKCED